MITSQTLELESLIAEALDAGVTLYEKDGRLAFRQKDTFPEALKSKVIANKADLVSYFQQQRTHTVAAHDGIIPPIARTEQLPLSFAQESLWFIEQLHGGQQYYMPASFRLTGELDVDALKYAIGQVIERHESLRCQFLAGDESNGKPYARIMRDFETPFEWLDVSQLSNDEKAEQIDSHIKHFCTQEFNLESGCLIRVLVLSDTHQHRLFFNMHHIVSDGASMANLVDEVATIYNAALSKSQLQLPTLALQYVDYAAWQRAQLCDESFSAHLAYFKSQLAGLDPLQSLPSDKPRMAVQTEQGARYVQSLSLDLTKRIVSLSSAQQSSLFMWLSSGVMLFIARLNQQSRAVVGTPVLGRDNPQLEHLIGLFVNTLVMHAEVDEQLSCEQWFAEQKARNLAALEYRALPFDKLVEHLGQTRDLSHHPVVQILFSLTQPDEQTLTLNGLEVEECKALDNQSVAVKCDLELHAQFDGEALVVHWKYDSDLYHRETIQNWASSFAVMLEGIVNHPTMAVGDVPLLDESHANQLLSQPQCQASWPEQHSIVSLLEQQVINVDSRTAVTDGTSSLTYTELGVRIDALACALIAEGVKPQQLVPVSMTRSTDMVAALLAILKAGGAYVPIDPSYPQERIEYILSDINSDLLVCDEQSAALFSQLTVRCIVADRAIDAHSGRQFVAPKIQPDHLAYVIYTSGTTGKPKGVQIEHRHVVRLLFTEPSLFDFNEQDVWSLFHSFCFDFSVWEMYGALLFGGKLVVVDSDTAKDTESFAKLLLREGVTVLNQTPSAFYVLQSCMQRLVEETHQQPTIRYVIFGGEALQPSKIKPWRKLVPACQLINMYGITETTVHVTFKRLSDEDLAVGQSNIGKPIQTTSSYVLDNQQRLLPQGAIGELYVGGEGVARGYWQRPELNQQRFVELSLAKGHSERLYRSGDLVRLLPDGEMTYIGRIDDQVKVRGYRIELGEIENQLRMHPWVDEAVVILNQHPVKGAYVAAFITEGDDAAFTDLSAQLNTFLKATLPDFMLPSFASSVSKMPLTVNGKVDKKALLSLIEIDNDKAPFEAPATPVEIQVADAFKSVLQCPHDVGLQDDFFTLGGHSLLAVELCYYLKARFGLDAVLSELFQYSSVKALAQRLADKASVSEASVVPALQCTQQTQGPVSFAQQRLWALDSIQGAEQAVAVYHVPMSFLLKGELNLSAFEAAWQQVIERHAILRTVIYTDQSGAPKQRVLPDFSVPLQVVDVSDKSAQQSNLTWRKLQRDDDQQAFDLERDLMIRVHLLKLSQREFKLRINVHHIACDAHALRLIVDDLAVEYQHACDGTKADVGCEVTEKITYLDYAIWQQSQLQGAAHQAFWQNYLAGAPQVHELALDGVRSNQSQQLGATHISNFDSALSEHITLQCQRLGMSHFMWLHTLFSVCIARCSQVSDVVVGSPFSGRHHAQLKDIVGFFVNVLPIRVQFTPEMTLESLLAAQKAQILAVHEHQAVPFEQISALCEPHTDLSHHSLFQISFAFDPKDHTELTLGDIQVTALDEPNSQAKFELDLTCSEQSDGIRLNWVYDKTLFSHHSIAGLADAFEAMVTAAVTNLDQRVTELPLVKTETWQKRMLCGEQYALCSPSVLQPIWAHQNTECANQTALVDRDGTCMNYGELLSAAEQLAMYLTEQGLQNDDRVMICLSAGSRWITALLAVMRAGACYVPVDPSYPQSRIQFIAKDSDCKFVLTNSSGFDLLNHRDVSSAQLIDVDALDLTSIQGAMLPSLPANSAQLAYVIYTSGTTGQPKGVMNTHQGLMNLCQWHQRAFAVDSHSVATQTASVAFDAAAWEVWPYLVAGAQLVFLPKATFSDARRLTQAMQIHQVTHSFLATPVAQAVLADSEFNPLSLRYLMVGGDKLAPVDTSGHPFALINNYGPTESAVVATSGLVDLGATTPDIGLPIDNTQLLILNAQQQLQPSGAIGELCIAGDSLASGYLGRTALTTERFINWRAPTGESMRVYRTGDLVRQIANGRLAYIGRNDDQIKLRGYRIELDEIESQLSVLPEVEQAIVLLCDSGDAGACLVAFICQTAALDEQTLSKQLEAQLCDALPAHMLPSEYVLLAEMPLTPHGKVDKPSLRMQVKHKVSVPTVSSTDTEEGLPESSRALLQVYRTLLKRPDLQPADDFFAMGGDSILSIQIATRARALGFDLAVSDVLTYSSVAQLSTHFAQAALCIDSTPSNQVTYVPSRGKASLLPTQYWFFEQQFALPTHWNQAVMLGLDKSVSALQLEAAVTALIARHDSLRLTVAANNTLHFVDGLCASAIVHTCDLSCKGDWQDAWQNTCQQWQRSLKFNGSPLVRFIMADTGQKDVKNRVCIIAHHLIIDGVSWRLVLEGLFHALQMSVTDDAISLIPPKVSIQQVSQALRDHAQHHAKVDDWLPVVQAASKQTYFDMHEQTAAQVTVHSLQLKLTTSQTQALLTVANKAYGTQIQTLLLAAVHLTLFKLTDAQSHVLMMEGHGRGALQGQIDSSDTVGWMTAMYPLHLFVNATTMGDMICAAKEALAAVQDKASDYGTLRYLHSDAKVREALAIDTSKLVFFNYLGQLDSVIHSAGPLSDVNESCGDLIAPDNHCFYAMQLTSSIQAECLCMHCDFDAMQISQATAEAFVAQLQSAIDEVLTHCSQQTRRHYTQSDFHLLPTCSNRGLAQLIAQSPEQAVADIYPLSPLQQGMWFQTQLADAKSQSARPYLEQCCFMFAGNFDCEAFIYAWQQVIKQHSILRSAFTSLDGQPVQVVLEQAETPVELINIQGQEEQGVYFDQLAQQAYQQGIVLNQAPCMRLQLVLMSEQRVGFIWTYHHMIMDGWSLPVLFSELLRFYNARIDGQTAAIRSDNFAEYIAYTQQRDRAEEAAFWQVYLSDIDSPTLISDCLKTTINEPVQYQECHQVLSEAQCQGMAQTASELGLTANQLIQAVFAYWLSVCLGRSEVMFGQTVAGRPTALSNMASRVGPYINTQAVYTQIDMQMCVADYLQGFKANVTALSQYPHSSLSDVQTWSQIDNQQDLFDVLYVFENYPTDPLSQGPSLPFEIISSDYQDQTHYPLSLVVGGDKQLSLTLCYQTCVLNEAQSQHFVAMLAQLLKQVCEQPTQKLCELSNTLHGQVESEFTRFELADKAHTVDEYTPRAETLADAFMQTAAEHSCETALVYFDNGDISPSACLSYAELDAQSNRLAHWLVEQIGHRDSQPIVGIAIEPRADLIIAVLAVLKAGAAYVPLTSALPLQRKQLIVASCQAALVLTDSAIWQDQDAPCRTYQVDDVNAQLDCYSGDALKSTSLGSDLGYVIYTSGTTGVPKGVMVEQRSILNYVRSLSAQYEINSADNYLQFASFSFDVFAEEVFCALLRGATLVMAEPSQLLDTARLSELTHDADISLMSLPTAYWHQLCAVPQEFSSSLRLITIGGEQMQLAALKSWQKNQGTQIRLVNAYGPTETTISATLQEVTDWQDEDIAIGRPVNGLQLHVLDAQLRPLPQYVAGELYISGVGLARGYLGDTKKTAEAFITDSHTGLRLYKSGDLVKLNARNEVIFLGRRDGQVKVRGYRIELADIESQLMAIAGIGNCAVVVRQDSSGNEQLVAFIESASLQGDASELHEILSAKLPSYMVPQLITSIDALPHTSSGKLDRKALVAHAKGLSLQTHAKAKPQSRLEVGIAARFAQLLKVDLVGLDDDFFVLGGHSLLVMQLVAEIQSQLAITVPLAAVMQHSTVRSLANFIDTQCATEYQQENAPTSVMCLQQGEVGFTPVVLIAGAGGLLISFVQLVDKLDARIPVYGLQPDLIADKPDVIGDIHQTAKHYLQVLERDFEQVHVVTHSFGAFIGYELCLLSQHSELTCTSLTILDTPLPSQPNASVDERQIDKFVLHDLCEFFSLSPRQNEIEHYSQMAGMAKFALLSDWLSHVDVHMSAQQLATFYQVYKAQLLSNVVIDTPLLDVKVKVIKAADTKEFEGRAVKLDMGWQRVVENLTALEVAGDHLSILQNKADMQALVTQIEKRYILHS
ncbi:non-ribosomal peptide synthetase [Pseudoalteromonas umbrosa]|uniref:non-ribosomal peptide synthetase n=1 Tax=Pseudoalteromonas umbrosa TaxID=3048489 RepID=UPI0024C452FD|nr:non-ribosomal peptide synthetase [Pseudoalteromonas sp. B95]MDK1289024.1 amino acid adenylation domain-containing protein [Pseudoalteromonas sp. B95]